MAYAQWVYMLIHNKMKSGNLMVKRSACTWGKFYEYNNKDKEMKCPQVEAKCAGPNGGEMGVAACGRSDSASGTEGYFDIYDGETHVCHVYWDCPWGSKTNKFEVTNVCDDYGVTPAGMNLEDGAIGMCTIKIGKYA